MNKQLAAVLSLLAILIVVGAAIMIVSQPQPSASAQAAPTQTASSDTANPVYLSNTYKIDGQLPLKTWQPITVYGETFPACALSYEGRQTVLTLDPEDSQICGSLSLSPKGE